MAPHDQTDAQNTANPLAEKFLKPPLQQALNNLNVHLEDELTHYRRQMHGQSPPPVPKLRVGKGPKPSIDLISVQASEVSPGATQSTPGPAVPGPAVVLPPPPPNPFLQDQADDGGMPDQGAAVEGAADSSAVDALAEAAAEPAVVSDMANAEAVATSDLSVRQATEPEGYLESSEELLKSLADDPVGDGVAHAPSKPYRPGGMSRLTTPLGMGLLMLLMVGSLGIGYLMLNPSALDAVRAWFPSPSGTAESETASEEGSSEEGGSGEATAEEGGFSPPGPDLSKREFVELDLESLSTLEVEGATPSPAAPLPASPPATTTAPAPLPANNTAQLPAPGTTAPGTTAPGTAAPGTTAPAPAAPSTPAPVASPAPAVPAPAATPAPAAPVVGRNYYVITNYTGDPSLNQVRAVVTDAFVRNFKDGTRIQLGAFDNAETAQQYVQELQQQGLTSQLYGPTDE